LDTIPRNCAATENRRRTEGLQTVEKTPSHMETTNRNQATFDQTAPTGVPPTTISMRPDIVKGEGRRGGVDRFVEASRGRPFVLFSGEY
jgi:hypothetical protein